MKSPRSLLAAVAAVASFTALSFAAPAEAQPFPRGARAVAGRPAYAPPSFAPPPEVQISSPMAAPTKPSRSISQSFR